MKTIYSAFLLLFLLAVPALIFAQDDEEPQFCVPVNNKKAIELYNKAKNRKKYDKREERVNFLNKALELEPDFVEAQYQWTREFLATWKLGKMKFAPLAIMYKNIIRLCPNFHSDPYYYLGYDYYEQMDLDTAQKYLKSFLEFKETDEKKYASPADYAHMVDNAKMMIAQIQIDIAKAKKKVPFDPKVLLPISTKYDEFLCAVAPDDSSFLFTRREPIKVMDGSYEREEWKETFMIAKRKKDGNFDEGEPMPDPFNKNLREGGPSLTINGKRLYYTVFANDGAGANADIYFSDYTDNDGWSKPAKVPNINDPTAWDSQPTVSADGNTIFFASDRAGGIGAVDIYMAFRDPKTGQFGKALNLGPGINTPMVEKCPFIHSDSETLYYCSEGMPTGYGGLDIYFVRKDEAGNWRIPENIGYPINSPEDDAGFIVSTDGLHGYFAAEPSDKVRGLGVGKYDIYRFELYKEARPQEVTFVRGELKDKDGLAVKGATLEIKNPVTKEVVSGVVDSTSGNFVVAVNKKVFKEKIVIIAKKDDHAFSATVVDVKDATFKDPPKDVQLEVKEMAVNERFVINEIHYKTNSAELDPASFIMLDEFASWLKEHPKMKIEIGGHTDNVGKPDANLALSSDRAFTIKAYLEDKGIDGKRISAKGYGDKAPIADNASAEGRAANRRTEFKILAK
jgi:outer membrane protein OmpA-like peptidoglycan-associated protein/tetratricopeptide (TPR) repeat protein